MIKKVDELNEQKSSTWNVSKQDLIKLLKSHFNKNLNASVKDVEINPDKIDSMQFIVIKYVNRK